MASLLKHLHDLIFVFRENLSETIRTLNQVVLGSTGKTAVDEFLRVVNLCSESKHLAGFLCNSNGITSKHLDGNTELLGFNNGLSSVLTRRIEHR